MKECFWSYINILLGLFRANLSLSVTTQIQTQSSAWYPKCASNYQALTSYVVCPDFVYGLL